MNRRVRIGITLSLVGIVVVVMGFILLSNIIKRTLYSPPAATQAAPVTQKVVIASHDIEMGTLQGEGDLALLDVPVEMAPRNSFDSIDTLIGRYANYPLVQNEMVLDHQLADPVNVAHDIAYTMTDDMVLMAIPATDLMSRLAVIKRDDVIDMFISLDMPVENAPTQLTADGETTELTRLFTFDSMQNVKITAVVADVVTQETEQGTQTQVTNVQAYLLAMDPQDALVLKHLIDIGAKFDFVLRTPTAENLLELSPVMQEYLLDRYNLELTPTETP